MKPTGKRWINAHKMWCCFHDEAPNVGSGWRSVYYIEGRKWAFVAGRDGRNKLRMSVWLTIKAASERRLQQ